MRSFKWIVSASFFAGCFTEPTSDNLTVAHVRQQAGNVAGSVSLIDSDGNPVALGDGELVVASTRAQAPEQPTLTVETLGVDGVWRSATNITVARGNSANLIDAVVVTDNSGSQAEVIHELRDAVRHFTEVLLARNPTDRAGLVRVSTEVRTLAGLSSDLSSLGPAIEGMFVNRGRTALWDGIRVANELIDSTAAAPSDREDGSCFVPRTPNIVVFTNGRDNNSADEYTNEQYPGDGVDTTLDDLFDLQARGVATAVHVVSIGDEPDNDALSALAAQTGARHVNIQGVSGLQGALHGVAGEMGHMLPVCFVPAQCSDTEARITVTIPRGPGTGDHVATTNLAPSCR